MVEINLTDLLTGSRKSAKRDSGKVVKYCSDRCRGRKPGPLDRKIEEAIVSLLNGEEDSGIEGTGAKGRVVKGDRRLVVTMDEIEEVVFGSRFDPEKVYGRRKNRKSRVIRGKEGEGEWKSVDMQSSDESSEAATSEDDEDEGGASLGQKTNARARPPQTESEVNFSVGGERGRAEKIEETAGDAMKRHEGQKRADEREMVRRAARRGVVFGFETNAPIDIDEGVRRKGKKKHTDDTESPSPEQPRRRKCEALMQGSLVEPSFAKGNWSIRWREQS